MMENSEKFEREILVDEIKKYNPKLPLNSLDFSMDVLEEMVKPMRESMRSGR